LQGLKLTILEQLYIFSDAVMGQLCAELNLKFKRNEKCIFLISDKGKALKIKNTIKEKSSTTFPVGTEIREHLVVYHQNKII